MTSVTLASDTVLVRAVGQVSCPLGDEVVILQVDPGRYFGLQGVGARIWELLDHPVAVSEIERIIMVEYEVEADRCRRDLAVFLSGLITRGLAEIRT